MFDQKGNKMQLSRSGVDPVLWTPDNPKIYDIKVSVIRDGEVIDEASTYIAYRTISVKEDTFGRRLYLNGKPLFQIGPLDQGW